MEILNWNVSTVCKIAVSVIIWCSVIQSDVIETRFMALIMSFHSVTLLLFNNIINILLRSYIYIGVSITLSKPQLYV